MTADELVVELYKETKKKFDEMVKLYNKAVEKIEVLEDIIEIFQNHSSIDSHKISTYISSITDMEDYETVQEYFCPESEEEE